MATKTPQRWLQLPLCDLTGVWPKFKPDSVVWVHIRAASSCIVLCNKDFGQSTFLVYTDLSQTQNQNCWRQKFLFPEKGWLRPSTASLAGNCTAFWVSLKGYQTRTASFGWVGWCWNQRRLSAGPGLKPSPWILHWHNIQFEHQTLFTTQMQTKRNLIVAASSVY